MSTYEPYKTVKITDMRLSQLNEYSGELNLDIKVEGKWHTLITTSNIYNDLQAMFDQVEIN